MVYGMAEYDNGSNYPAIARIRPEGFRIIEFKSDEQGRRLEILHFRDTPMGPSLAMGVQPLGHSVEKLGPYRQVNLDDFERGIFADEGYWKAIFRQRRQRERAGLQLVS